MIGRLALPPPGYDHVYEDGKLRIQISAPVQPGNSGGPLLDQFGNVIGVVVGKVDALQNVNFAIKSTMALNFLEANGIRPDMSMSSDRIDQTDIAERAKSFSVQIECEAPILKKHLDCCDYRYSNSGWTEFLCRNSRRGVPGILLGAILPLIY